MRRVEQLLAAAEELFARDGYGAVGMNAIARHANAPIGSLYQFFPTKESIAITLIERYMEQIKRCWHELGPKLEAMNFDEFAAILVAETLDVISRQAAFSTLDEAQATLQLRPSNRDELASELVTMIARFRPQAPGDVRVRLSVMTLQMLKAAYALEKSGARTIMNPRSEVAMLISSYFQRWLEPESAGERKKRASA